MANCKCSSQRTFGINPTISAFSEWAKKSLLQDLRGTRGFAGSFSLSVANARLDGGQGGIRTLDGLAPILVFETSAFNLSATCPYWGLLEVLCYKGTGRDFQGCGKYACETPAKPLFYSVSVLLGPWFEDGENAFDVDFVSFPEVVAGFFEIRHYRQVEEGAVMFPEAIALAVKAGGFGQIKGPERDVADGGAFHEAGKYFVVGM